MRKRDIKHILATGVLSLVLGTLTGSALAQQSQIRRVLPGETDGDQRVYVVRCVNGTSGTVIAGGKNKAYCATARGGKQRCSQRWSLNEASENACKVKAR